ncbi:MAG: DinB family protein [Pseudonocardiales bacterium]|nr:DinB family protein [Pseudonocardiales bacterium]
MLDAHRHGLRQTMSDVTDEQAVARPTVSALCLGGLLKHVTYAETLWIDFVVDGKKDDDLDRYAASFRVEPGESVANLLVEYVEAARRTDEVVAGLPDLDVSYPLPEAPWYPPNTSWSARQVLLHILAETTQHAGHADIIKETILAA